MQCVAPSLRDSSCHALKGLSRSEGKQESSDAVDEDVDELTRTFQSALEGLKSKASQLDEVSPRKLTRRKAD